MKNIYLFLTIVLLAGCSRWVAPPYTNVDRLSNLQTGTTLNQVNSELGIEPYDIYFKGDNDFIVVYNYRVKDRILRAKGDADNKTHTALSQYAGKDWYGDKYFCYVYFEDRLVKSVMTDRGKLRSQDILVKNNNIYLIQRDELGYYEDNDTIIFVPMR